MESELVDDENENEHNVNVLYATIEHKDQSSVMDKNDVQLGPEDPELDELTRELSNRLKLKEDLNAQIKFNQRKLINASTARSPALSDRDSDGQESEDLMLEGLLLDTNNVSLVQEANRFVRKEKLKRELLRLKQLENRQRFFIFIFFQFFFYFFFIFNPWSPSK